jgi:hypothetical protein
MSLSLLEKWVKVTFFCTGSILTVYIAFSTLGLVSNSKIHYANFALGIMILSGIYGLQTLLEERKKKNITKNFLFASFVIIGW